MGAAVGADAVTVGVLGGDGTAAGAGTGVSGSLPPVKRTTSCRESGTTDLAWQEARRREGVEKLADPSRTNQYVGCRCRDGDLASGQVLD